MWMSGILTAVGFVFIAAKFSPTLLQRMLGYDWVVDAAMTVGIMYVFGATGTISGMMAGVVTGLSISVILWLAKNTGTYQKLSKESGHWEWKSYHGKYTLPYIAEALHRWLSGLSTNLVEVKQGWDKGAANDTTVSAAA